MNFNVMTLNQWKFKACDESEWLPAQVPGCVHTDLLKNGIIPDPFYGTNEHDLQWIDKKDWEYETSFDLDSNLSAQSRIELVFDGLDTYADVFVNGAKVLSADNMFRSWRIDVKSQLKDSGNVMKIRFRSPIQEDLPKLEKLGYPLPASNDQSEVGGMGDQKVSIFARKAPYHYGWDWGPRFVTSGIWREARLEAWSELRLDDLFIRQDEVTEEMARVTAVATIAAEQAWQGVLRVSAGGQTWEQDVRLEEGRHSVELSLELAEPKLWWCRGLGEAHLYSFHAELAEAERTVAEKKVRTGLRSVKLVREQDSRGTSFYIELNGTPVFAKGANHIPNDSFITEVTAERYRHEIASAAESNMNMLRVWGGGIYEEDVFYDLCDEYGLMVWQDFMFACSMYPGDEAFLENVRLEAEENLVRLRNHPSIVLWCGNNEIDSAWAHYEEKGGWGWKQDYTEELREKIWSDYEKIFHEILPEAVTGYAPGAEYWPSSPLVSLSHDKEQHANPSTTSGDIHYWGVWHNTEPFDNYNVYVGRFMSEYGFQSFPEPKTVRTYAEDRDMELESKVMLAHQKNGAGNRLIKSYMDQYYNEPKDFEAFLYMSQIQQAEAMKTAIEAHRRNKPYCMGTLYWQMNDCWPVASWAGMDYLGRWKALQYAAKRCFRDVSLSVESKEQEIRVHLVSDISEAVQGTLKVQLFDFNGKELYGSEQPIRAEEQASLVVFRAAADELLRGHDPSEVVLVAQWLQDGVVVDSKTFYFVNDKHLRLHSPAISVKEVEGSDGTAFVLESNVLARHVWLSAEEEGFYSDNFFDLIPGIPVTVSFSRRDNGEQAFVPGKPGRAEVRSMADCIDPSMVLTV
ncbi:glycoside hydrolase family 2 protein [Paenibacillus sp. BR1-192]|uniref:glycoside hydrolase family 2 protein n=1 Tax=Paenibacillus sp. BR1-192 TaxID=3032287 RepID=UPI00240CF749|nr:glycoside hydrolase family 2 protein [Paenibacillus sp. BR1-192]WFB59939.1 glycoside hydrolase family 2 TIM barrel-domain containing protein [Paenibacillus sp. BR1-192]